MAASVDHRGRDAARSKRTGNTQVGSEVEVGSEAVNPYDYERSHIGAGSE
jgi:hypothetical protein